MGSGQQWYKSNINKDALLPSASRRNCTPMRFFRLATVVAAAASVASAMVETSDPLDSAAEVHRVYSRAGQTGCTCYGYTYFIQGMYNNNYIVSRPEFGSVNDRIFSMPTIWPSPD